jgi:ATP-dependent helicase/nuclease subunit A
MSRFGKISARRKKLMANQWTDKQLKAINTEGRNILVAAAAGSGKTAVLVERIIKKITREDGPDIDRMVVVTFTKAAAAEMKQRIREALDKELEKNPDNDRLIRQLTLVHNAPITTIDSFCLNIVRNYFTDIDIDPGFRTADEGEIKLLENDVMNEMLEEYYASKNEDFYNLVDSYGQGRNDSKIIDIILQIYKFARSNPWYDEWFLECLSVYEIDDEKSADDNPAIAYLCQDIKRRFMDYEVLYADLEKICSEPDGPSMYAAAVISDRAGIQQILSADSFSELVRKIRLISFDTLGRSRSKDVSEEKKAYVKSMRDGYKNYVQKTLKGKIFVKDYDGLIQDIKDNKTAIKCMLMLAKDFLNRMQAEKRERNIIDFNDMEHMALDILVKKENGELVYTKAADDLSEFYEEILIDEYQDSNLLQEVILTAVSKGKRNPENNNIYMVGDVKQSIYRFRLARPELFLQKYNTYTNEESPCVKIELQNNFRSRANVLNCTNTVFKMAMNPEYTGIVYDEKAQLNLGLNYPENTDKNAVSFGEEAESEILLIDMKEQEDISESQEEYNDREIQADAAVNLIQRLVKPKDGKTYVVYDKNIEGNYRPIRYSDIVILTRTVSGWADTFVNVLMNNDIPAYSDASEGYFDVREVKLILSYLTVLDNPLQDIPMAAVLLSYFGGLDTEELTALRMLAPDRHLYDACKESKEQKITDFLQTFNEIRRKAELVPLTDLLWELMYDMGYYDYVGTMPAGAQRQANLDMLFSKAAAFEKTSYSGLFQFLRYIERLRKYEVDFAEVSMLGENEDLVRVMSIHKSKGLEFPVVILAGMGKKINKMDLRGDVVIDTDLGIGTNVVHLDRRTKNSTFIKSAVTAKLSQESVSEELRVLYVAMTRAREKLFMLGTVKDADKHLEEWSRTAGGLSEKQCYSYSYVSSLSTYFDMVMPAVLYNQNHENPNGDFAVYTRTSQEISESILAETDSQDTKKEQPLIEEKELPPYPLDSHLKPKVTVSELKKSLYAENEEEVPVLEDFKKALDAENDAEEMEEITVPKFISGEKEKLAGSDRGTAYHKVMSYLRYDIPLNQKGIEEFLTKLCNEGKISTQQLDCIYRKDLLDFLKNPLGKRIGRAWENGKLYREQPFVFIDERQDNNQLIQGVIDLYFEEEDGFVLVDYKTDRVSDSSAGEEVLKKRYALQLDYYACALSQITGKPVKEKIIYSFSMGKALAVK